MPLWRRTPRNPLRVLVAGPPRSGTSLLANLMTAPPDTLVLYEPNLGRRAPSEFVRSQFTELGLPLPATNRALVRGLEKGRTRWGAKEVTADWIRWTYERFQPETVLLVVRDIGHAALSMYDRAGEAAPGVDLDFRAGWLARAAEAVAALYHRCDAARRVVVRYESFVTDPAAKGDLEARLGWELTGRTDVGFESQNRWHELRRHAGRISQSSLALRRSESDPRKLEFAQGVVASCRDYQRLFGYEASPAPAAAQAAAVSAT
jgi:hypothetical protein